MQLKDMSWHARSQKKGECERARERGRERERGRTDGRKDGWKEGRMEGRTDGRTDGWTDGRTDGRALHGVTNRGCLPLAFALLFGRFWRPSSMQNNISFQGVSRALFDRQNSSKTRAKTTSNLGLLSIAVSNVFPQARPNLLLYSTTQEPIPIPHCIQSSCFIFFDQ